MAFDKVLLVFDDEISRKDLEKQLHSRYDLRSVATTAAAQDQLSKANFDLVIADVELLNGGKQDLFEDLQLSAARPLLLVVSAFGQVESAVESLNHGAFAYLLRPFSKPQLETVLNKAEEHAHLLNVKEVLSRGGFDVTSEPLGNS